MAQTQLKGLDIGDTTVGRVDLNTGTAGNAVITKIVEAANTGILINASSGADTGTGDVSVKVDRTYLNALYQPNGTNPFVYTDNSGVLHIDGGIVQEGSTYETHAEQVYTTNDYIALRDGAVAGLSGGSFAGFQAKLYDGVHDGRLVFDNTGTARVGDVGFEQALATRIENPLDEYLATWDAGNVRLDFIPRNTFSLSGHNHSGTYEPLISKTTGYAKWSGGAWEFDNRTLLSANETITLSGEATGSGTTSIAVTLVNGAVIGKVLTGFSATSGVISATDSILTSIQKLGYDKHIPVTINATANGLSVSSQVLTLGLSSATTIGALSSTDWGAFNSKEPTISKSTGFLKWTGSAWSWDASTYLTANQSITLSGDVTGSGATFISVTLANSGVMVGTYTKVTVDAKGRVTVGANATTSDVSEGTNLYYTEGRVDANTNVAANTSVRHAAVTLATNHGLSLSGQVIGMGTPSTITGSTTNSVTTTTHAHAITGASLTKTDDTNITISLDGSATTALLNAASLTLGWTGTLADTRITSAATWNAKQAALNEGTGYVKSAAGTISYVNETYSLSTHIHSASGFTLLNDQWLQTTDYAGNAANLLKISKDNLIEFGAQVGINAFYHVLNSGTNDIVSIPVSAESASGEKHGIGITVGGIRLWEVAAESDGSGGIANSVMVINSGLKYANSPINGYYLKCTDANGKAEWKPIVGAGIYLGTYNGTTNTPTLTDGDGARVAGDWYICTTAGGAYSVNDQAYYNGATWQRVPSSYTLQIATDTILGGVKIGAGVTITSGVISVSTAYRASSWVPAWGDISGTTPTWNQNTTGTAATAENVTGVVAIANGGTGQTTAALARTALGLAIGTDVLAYRTFGTAANSATGDFVAYRTFGTAANSATTDFEVPLTFTTGLNRTGNTVSCTITQYTDGMSDARVVAGITGKQESLNGTGYVYFTGTTPSYRNETYSLSTHVHSGLALLNDQWLTSIDYAGNVANILKVSKDNLIEFGCVVGIGSLFTVADAGNVELANMPILHAASGDLMQYTIGISSGKQIKIGATADGASGMATQFVTIEPELTVNTITHSTIDNDKFIVSESGKIRYRTGDEIVSDLNTDARYLGFRTISKSIDSGFTWGTSNLVANLYNDTLKLVAGTNISIDTDTTSDGIRINNTYAHPAKTWVDKTNLSGAVIVSNLTIDSLGHPTNWTTRSLALSDLGYSGDTSADHYQYWTISGDAGSENVGIMGNVAFVGGNAIGTVYNPATNQLTINHSDTSTQSNLTASGRTYVTGIALDTYGHITSLSTGTETTTTFPGFGTTGSTAAYGNHTHAYLPLSGGTLTGALGGTSAVFSSTLSASEITATSDRRLKTKIVPIELRPISAEYVQYEMIDSPGILRYGVPAQDLLINDSELVRGNYDDGYTVSYIDLLIKEVACLKDEVKKLKLLVYGN